jgi:hypothetical protein
MSVAVSRQPPFNPIATHRRMSTPRAPSAPASIAPGLIRIQGGTTKTSSSPQRNSRSRQRKQQNRQSQDDTPQPIPSSDPVRNSPQSNKGNATAESVNVPSPASKDRTSPKRGSQLPHGKQQQHQLPQFKKQALQKHPLPVASQHKSAPRSPAKSRHQHTRPHRQFDLHDLSFSSADDSDETSAPVLSSPTRPATAPNTIAAEPAGRLAHARRNNSRDKRATVAPVADMDKGSGTVIPTLSPSIPIARNGRSGHTRAASTSDPFLSRSVPVSSLPDWDLPPPSFGTSSSNTSSRSDITAMLGVDLHHHLPLSEPQLSPPPATPEQRSQRPTPHPKAAVMSEGRLLVPWVETLEDEGERSAALHASAPLVSRSGRPGIPDSPAPRTPTRPARRHARTASVPSMSSVHGFSGSPAAPTAHRRYGGSPEQVNKYANGRFQSAPAPTFLPMPTFEA